MRIASILLVMSLSCVVCAQEGEAKAEHSAQGQQNIPTTLAEAHAELERILSAEELAKIDAMLSERDMIQYHFSLGLSIRNSWGLWQGGPLAKHMRELGFTHPDNMSGVILGTFWCKRHGQDFRLQERAVASKKAMEAARKAQEEEKKRVQEAIIAIQNMMMGLRFEKQDVPVVKMPIKSGMRVRFMCPFQGGVFFTAYRQGSRQDAAIVTDGICYDPAGRERRTEEQYDDGVARGHCWDAATDQLRKMKPGEDFYIVGYFLDLSDRKIHRILVPEVNDVYAAVGVGGRAWFAGLTEGKIVLLGVGDRDRIAVPLPQEDEIPDLGMDGQSLLAVYSKMIYRLTDRQWTLVHSGDILLPRSGLPPQRYGDRVFLRDEGLRENDKRLWWLTMGERLHLSVLDHDVGVVGPEGPRWENATSYAVTGNGDLWVSVGDGSSSKSLLRRSKDGSYSIAIMNDSTRFTGELLGSTEATPRVCVSAVTALPDDTLLLAGDTGLYRLKGNELVQELAFIRAETADDNSGTARSWNGYPGSVLALDDRSYILGTTMGDGVYLLHKGDDGQWNCQAVDGRTSETVVW
ncbi:MAG: DUF6794 domain-containing protein [Phycisphaerales bacterium]